MSSKPRDAIRGIVEANPRFGFWTLAMVYGIASNFFFAYFYSLGFSLSFLTIFVPLLATGSFVGSLLILFDAWILRKMGFLFGGKASFPYLRAAVAWSKVPYFISLCMWLIFTAQDPSTVFLHVSSDASALCIVLVSAAINFWAFALLVQSLQEIQSFSLFRALLYTAVSSLLSFIAICCFMFISRFIISSILSFF